MKRYNEHKTLVTTIIPVTGFVDYLKEAIDSVFNSTYTNNEIIVIDDIPDKYQSQRIRSICKKYKDYPVRYHKNNQPAGILKSIIEGVNISNGDYITILKPQDKFEMTWIEKGCVLLDKKLGDIIYSFAYHFGIQRGCMFLWHFDSKLLKQRNFIPYWAMFRKSDWNELKGINVEQGNHADWDYWLRCDEKGKKFFFIGEPLLYHRTMR